MTITVTMRFNKNYQSPIINPNDRFLLIVPQSGLLIGDTLW